jgi:hypothetical protein
MKGRRDAAAWAAAMEVLKPHGGDSKADVEAATATTAAGGLAEAVVAHSMRSAAQRNGGGGPPGS